MTTNSTIVIPASPGIRKRFRWWMLPAAVLVVGVALMLGLRPWKSADDPAATGQFYGVVPMDLDVKIVKDGELQAIRYIDVDCKVEGISQIVWLVKEGAYVEKGDELVKLDSSNLVLRKETLDLDLKRAESSLKISQELKGIQENQNAANEKAAEVTKELAELALQQYENGTYPQQLENAKTARDMAQITLKNREEDLDQTSRLFAKGFVTAADVKKAELDVTNARNELKKAETALLVLDKYTRKMDLAKLRSDVAQAEQTYRRTLRINISQMNQRNADLDEKENTLAMYKRQAKKLQEQIDYCTITAPEDGLVIYMSTIDRGGREPIQEGAGVRYSQSLIRLPDVRTMKAVVRIQEAQKPKLDVSRNQRATVEILGVPQPVGATLTKVSVLPDNSQRWWNPDLKEYPVELTLDETPTGLKPGTSCKATILIDRLESVLAVPLSAIYSVGLDSYVFVRGPDGVKERKIAIGVSNETHVQILDGLGENEQVLLLQPGQGRILLERAGIKILETRPGRENEPSTRPTEGDLKTQPLPDNATSKRRPRPNGAAHAGA